MQNSTRGGALQRAGTRILGAAEGVLVALCECSLDDAFLELVATAKRHNVAPLTLAATIVALAEDPSGSDCNEEAAFAAASAWEPLARRRATAKTCDAEVAKASRSSLLECQP